MLQLHMQIELPAEQVAEFCRRWQIAELAVFGSALREDFRADSDLDLLITPGNLHLVHLVELSSEFPKLRLGYICTTGLCLSTLS